MSLCLLCLSQVVACSVNEACVRPVLPTTPHPIMESIELKGGSYCMNEQSAKNILINLEKYSGALNKCNNTIILYNASVEPSK